MDLKVVGDLRMTCETEAFRAAAFMSSALDYDGAQSVR